MYNRLLTDKADHLRPDYGDDVGLLTHLQVNH